MPDKGGSMADEPKAGEDLAIRDHYDQRRPQDKPMPEFEREVRLEESKPAVKRAGDGGENEGESHDNQAGSIGTGTTSTPGSPGAPGGNAGSGMA